MAGIVDLTSFDWAPTLFDLTVDLLNKENNGFFDKELNDLGPISYQLLDGDCDGFTALSAYMEVRSQVDAFIAARCSSASKAIAWQTTFDNKAQISMSSTAEDL